jgi:hypothetical protein
VGCRNGMLRPEAVRKIGSDGEARIGRGRILDVPSAVAVAGLRRLARGMCDGTEDSLGFLRTGETGELRASLAKSSSSSRS